MTTVQRYEWLDALVDAQTAGVIGNGALLFASKIAKAINWKPRAGKPAGLYWKNTDAFKAVGTSRATYFRVKQSLFETGFLTEEKGNLIPQVPDASMIEALAAFQQSQVETNESHIETTESQVETGKSQGDTPFSVDTYTEDTYSEDVVSEEEPAAEPQASFSKILSLDISLNPSLTTHVVSLLDVENIWGVESEDDAQSHIETARAELEKWLDHDEQLAKDMPAYSAEDWVAIRKDAHRRVSDGQEPEKAVAAAKQWAVAW